MSQSLLVGIDLGSSRIRFAVGQVSRGERDAEGGTHPPALSLIGAVDIPSQGITKGVVTALEDAVAALSSGLEAVERQIGVPIQEAAVGVSGTHISVFPAKGVIGVSRADGDIRAEDVERVLEATKSAVNPANHEILHVLSHGFSVDGQGGIKDPIGMHGIRLEASAHLVLGLAGNVRNMTKCVFRTGLDISSLVFGPLAAAEAVTNTRERELGVCVVNIGASTTSVLVFEEGALLHAAVLPIGADHITSDIAIGLRTSLDAAEALKSTHGSALPQSVDTNEQIDFASFGVVPGEDDDAPTLAYVAEIIEARTEELVEKVEAELQRADRSGLLPAGVILTGGGAKLHGIADVAKRILRLPASVGAATHIATPMPELIHDPAFSTAVGLVQWAFEESRREDEGGSGRGMSNVFRSGNEIATKAKGLFKKVMKSFIP